MDTQVELPPAGLLYTDDSRVYEIENIRSVLKFECSDCGHQIGFDRLSKGMYTCPDCNSPYIEGVIEYWSISPHTPTVYRKIPVTGITAGKRSFFFFEQCI